MGMRDGSIDWVRRLEEKILGRWGENIDVKNDRMLV